MCSSFFFFLNKLTEQLFGVRRLCPKIDRGRHMQYTNKKAFSTFLKCIKMSVYSLKESMKAEKV